MNVKNQWLLLSTITKQLYKYRTSIIVGGKESQRNFERYEFTTFSVLKFKKLHKKCVHHIKQQSLPAAILFFLKIHIIIVFLAGLLTTKYLQFSIYFYFVFILLYFKNYYYRLSKTR